MTDRKELFLLQQNARRSGRVCNFFFDEGDVIFGVFYCGHPVDPLTFAEAERAKPAWYDLPAPEFKSFRAQRNADMGDAVRESLGISHRL